MMKSTPRPDVRGKKSRHGGILKRTLMAMVALACMLTAVAGCGHRGASQRAAKTSALDLEMMKLSKEQLFQRGEDQFAKKKFARARSYYTHLYENYPNDPLGRRALLRIADAFYEQGDAVNLVEAQYKYRDFINRYPGSDRADYAMLQIAMCSYKQMERPDRDQQKTREALEKFGDMLKTSPTARCGRRPRSGSRTCWTGWPVTNTSWSSTT
jgi:outer membrane assembly lipoprotein YfiO